MHTVSYSSHCHEYYQKAYIVREALVDPNFYMENYIKNQVKEYNDLRSTTYSGTRGSKSWVIRD